VPQGSVLDPLLFLAYVNDIWRNTEPNIRLFADDCIIYRKITDSNDIDKLKMDLNGLGELAVENRMKINPDKSKAVSFTKATVKERIRYYFGEQLIPEAQVGRSCQLHPTKSMEGSSFRNAYTQKGK